MKANETKIKEFLSSSDTQFIIPIYQRNYDWTISQCKQLLDDILEVAQNDNIGEHFIGSIVYIYDNTFTSSGIKELTIVDGQQRITTITLIYFVLYNLAKNINKESTLSADQIIETYLINKFASEEEKLKLKPTENNDKALKYLLRYNEAEDFTEDSRIIDNFNYFKENITKENYEFIRDGLLKLMFVEISLDRHKDNPQRIFESLNSTGLELSQADLIRNYILMRLNKHEQNKIYQDYWEVIENSAKDETLNISKVSDFMRDYLTLKNQKIPNKSKVYIEFKYRYPITTIDKLKDTLQDIKGLVKYYNKLINPKNEKDKEIRAQLEYINRLEINVAYPFLMKVYSDYDNEIINKSVFIDILNLIQSFSWRRFILGLATNTLNKIFMTLYNKVNYDDYLFSIQKVLVQKIGAQRFPKNAEVIDALKFKDVYNIKPKNRIYFLEKLENYKNNEKVIIYDNEEITIEHIFPQNPNASWENEIDDSEEFDYIKENYLHTIGNLTLSGNNGSLGNKTFKEKRDLQGLGYRHSSIQLNQYLATLNSWNRKEIEKRLEIIAEKFLKIWEYPKIDMSKIIKDEEINIFEADDPTNKKLSYAIFFSQKIKVNTVTELYIEVFKQLFSLESKIFFTTDLKDKINLVGESEKNKLNQAGKINDTYCIEKNIDSKSKFNLIKYALTVFDCEDELQIKYAE